MTDQTGRGYATDLFPADTEAARYSGTVLETSAERAARTGDHDQRVISYREHVRLLAFQAEQYARYADQTARTIARREVTTADAARQAVEDVRANRRNRNRFVALVVALLLGFLAPTICAFLHIPLQYSFCVVVLLDSIVTLYALVKHI